MNKADRTKKTNQTRQAFLLTFFENKGSSEEVKEVNGFILVKHHNGNTNLPEVAIMTPDAYRAYRSLRLEGII
jgi:hypothetical protein